MKTRSVFLCPHCGKKGATDPSQAGQEVQCPHCKGEFALPALATVRADALPAVPESDFPFIDTSPKPAPPTPPATPGQIQTPPANPVGYWVVGGLIILGVIGTIGSSIKDADNQAKEKRLEKRLAAELPDNAKGNQWLKASAEAKERFVKKFGPSWTYMSQDNVIARIDNYFDTAKRGLLKDWSLEDSVKVAIDKVATYKKSEDSYSRYSQRERDAAKTEMRRHGHDVDDERAEAILNLKTIMEGR